MAARKKTTTQAKAAEAADETAAAKPDKAASTQELPSVPKSEPDRVAMLSVRADGTPDQHEPVIIGED